MAHVKLILLQDVEDLGLAGEEVHVAAGYARNYLIPRGFATVASTGVLRQLEARKEKIEAKRKADFEAAQALSAKIATLDITIPMQASEDGHLFGSVSERTIFEKLASMDVKVNIGIVMSRDAILAERAWAASKSAWRFASIFSLRASSWRSTPVDAMVANPRGIR